MGVQSEDTSLQGPEQRQGLTARTAADVENPGFFLKGTGKSQSPQR